MITIEQTENLVNIAVMGEFTLADFKTFEEQSLYKLKSAGTVNLLFDLRAMIDYTVDVAWEEIKFFSREHNHDFSKIAVVTDDSGSHGKPGYRACSWMQRFAHSATTMRLKPGFRVNSGIVRTNNADVKPAQRLLADTGERQAGFH